MHALWAVPVSKYVVTAVSRFLAAACEGMDVVSFIDLRIGECGGEVSARWLSGVGRNVNDINTLQIIRVCSSEPISSLVA